MTALVSIRQVVKGYVRGKQRVEVLHALDLDVEQGEFLALMGPSGSGKTTLLNLIGGLDRPDRGEISVAGQRIDKMSSGQLAKWRARHVGFIFQFYNLLPVLTAERNVEVPLLLTTLGSRERMTRVHAALELVGLADRGKHRPTELSGGQQQRVAIARALVTKPAILLADEPTGNLDSKSGADVLALLHELNDGGTTVVLITHDSDVADAAKRSVHVRDGRLAA
jgi:putative ABC transport system ATP-binding protein